ncbi:hypothetical protein TWF694_005595 [Orbilia ellipsospora]|uniref:Uncharacterized protein n=1 Tax=Orbilia ellipsospora TaxID=2528407 RepID=A0AAV9WUM8_9PEZI
MTLDPNPLLSQDSEVTLIHPTIADKLINYLIIFALLLVLETIWQAVLKPHYFPAHQRTTTGIIPRIVIHSPEGQNQFQAVLQQQNSGGLEVEKYYVSEEEMRIITANTLMAMEEGRVKIERGGWD